MAQLANKPCSGDWSLEGDWSKRHEEQFAALTAAAAKVDPAVSLVGAIVSFPWADGRAHYRVASDKPLKLEPIPVFDAWQVPYTQIRGLRRADIVAMVERERNISKLFISS
jgi:hypothetical protein